MKCKIIIVACGLLFLLAGCATTNQLWYPTKEGLDFNKDKYECVQESKTSWEGGGTGLLGLAVMAGAAASASIQADSLFNMCMEARGYVLKEAPLLQPETNTLNPVTSEKPIQAVSTTPSTMLSKDNSFKITLPAGWVQAPPPASSWKLFAKNSLIDAGLMMSSVNSSNAHVDSKARAFRFRYILGIGKAGNKRFSPQRFSLYHRALPVRSAISAQLSANNTQVEEKAIEAKQLSIENSLTVSAARKTDFIAYDNGTVLDTKSRLMWAAKDNGANINWYEAKSYCENYRGGGYTDWRLPTLDELAGLYDPDNQNRYGYQIATDLIELTHWWVWSSEVADIQNWQAYAESLKVKLMGNLSQSTSSEMRKIKVNGFDALQVDIGGTAKNGMKLHYLETFIKTDKQLVQLLIWCVESKFMAYRSEFESLAGGLQK